MVAISVIIPVYNVEKYLGRCLDSVVNQTFTDIEIICINDGSSDNSLEILKRYAQRDRRIKIFTQENSGLSASRNVGMKYASGDYIYFIDSDDYLVKTAFEELYKIATINNTDLIIFKLLNFENQTNHVISKRYHEMFFLKNINYIFNYKDIKEHLFSVDVTTCTKFFKRELLDGLHFQEGLIFEDNLFYVDYIFEAKRIIFYDKYLYNRRIRPDSITRGNGKNHMDILEISNRIIDKTKKLGCYEEFKTQLFDFKMRHLYLRFTNIQSEYQQSFFNLIKNDFDRNKHEYMAIKDAEDKSKVIFGNMVMSESIKEFELRMEQFEYLLELRKMGERNQELVDEINSLKQDLNHSKHVNDLIMSSNSWKITSPFRALTRLFKKK